MSKRRSLKGYLPDAVADLESVHDIHSLYYLAKERVAAVQVWRGRMGDEKLRSLGVRAGRSHADATLVVVIKGSDLRSQRKSSAP
jgi:hypothetical protein